MPTNLVVNFNKYYFTGLLNINGIYQRVWINGNDVTNEGSWVWTDGTPGISFHMC